MVLSPALANHANNWMAIHAPMTSHCHHEMLVQKIFRIVLRPVALKIPMTRSTAARDLAHAPAAEPKVFA